MTFDAWDKANPPCMYVTEEVKWPGDNWLSTILRRERRLAWLACDKEHAREAERTFPIQSQRGAAPHPARIPWSVADKAYSVYSARYGKSQSLERMAERGGFGPGEMDMFLPGWREECSELATLRARLAAVESDNTATLIKLNRLDEQLAALQELHGCTCVERDGLLNRLAMMEDKAREVLADVMEYHAWRQKNGFPIAGSKAKADALATLVRP